MENDRLKQQIDAGAMAQPVEEESVKGLTAQGINLSRNPKILQNNFITVARDRDSDSERLLYFGRVIFFYFFKFFLFFFRPPNFRRPWADFHETLPHDAVCAEIVYLL